MAAMGLALRDMPSSDDVWGEFLRRRGFVKRILPDTCPYCYTVRQFAIDHPYGRYLLKTSWHVVAVVDGCYFDTSDSGNEVPIYYWAKED